MTEPRPDTKGKSGLKKELVKTFAIALASFVTGFAIIFFFLKPSSPDVSAEEAAPEAPLPSTPAANVAPAVPEPSVTAAPAAATIPEGEIPADTRREGDPLYLKCWDDSGIERDGAECDRLDALTTRFDGRLYVVARCRDEHAGAGTAGRLQVAAEVDFAQNTVSLWNGAASDIRNARDIGDCLRTALSGLPIDGIAHRFSRYRIYFPVAFGPPPAPAVSAEPSATAEADDDPTATTVPSAPPAGEGRVVAVTKTKVRVRKEPDANAEAIGTISAPNQVRLVKQDGDWCNVVTPNSNNGWMICSALSL